MLYIRYIILVILVVVLSLFLSKYVDALDKKSNLSGAFIGGVLLAGVTSLPEFITSLTAIFSLDEPNLVQGNVFGSNVFNFAVLGACILLFSKKYKNAKLSPSHFLANTLTLILFVVCFLGMKFNSYLKLGFLSVSYSSLIILAIYVFNISKMNQDENASNTDDDTINLTLKQIIFRFILCSVFLIISSILLTNVSDKLSEQLGIGATVGGAIFLGVATSLPELTSSLNLVRLGNFNAGFGNVTGSNLFNFTILAISDFFYSKGNIFNPDNQAFNLIFWGAVSSILVAFAIFSKKSQKTSIVFSVLIVSSYVASIFFSI